MVCLARYLYSTLLKYHAMTPQDMFLSIKPVHQESVESVPTTWAKYYILVLHFIILFLQSLCLGGCCHVRTMRERFRVPSA